MNRGVLQSSPVQQQMMAGSPNWWNLNNMMMMRPPPPPTNHSSPPQPSPTTTTTFMAPHFLPTTTTTTTSPLPPSSSSSSSSSSWNDHNQEVLPESWSQLLLGGIVGEEDKCGMGKKNMENWEEQVVLLLNHHHQPHHVKQENSSNTTYDVYGHGNVDQYPHHHHHHQPQPSVILPAAWSQMMPPVSSPNSCLTTTTTTTSPNPNPTTLTNNMLDFSTNNNPDKRHPPPDLSSSECNSTATGGAAKKARVQPSSTPSTFKVRKEKVGDRITALHQLVSPFGKTDTASVLLEAIGYIRFLQNQIEALSLPYLGSGSSANMRQQQQHQQQQHCVSKLQGEMNCLFPEDPGQLLNDSCMKRKGASEQDCNEEGKKDLRSRGLCLVPISCTLQVGSDNGADYWAPAAIGGGFR